jgi:hypothetical protein
MPAAHDARSSPRALGMRCVKQRPCLGPRSIGAASNTRLQGKDASDRTLTPDEGLHVGGAPGDVLLEQPISAHAKGTGRTASTDVTTLSQPLGEIATGGKLVQAAKAKPEAPQKWRSPYRSDC